MLHYRTCACALFMPCVCLRGLTPGCAFLDLTWQTNARAWARSTIDCGRCWALCKMLRVSPMLCSSGLAMRVSPMLCSSGLAMRVSTRIFCSVLCSAIFRRSIVAFCLNDERNGRSVERTRDCLRVWSALSRILHAMPAWHVQTDRSPNVCKSRWIAYLGPASLGIRVSTRIFCSVLCSAWPLKRDSAW